MCSGYYWWVAGLCRLSLVFCAGSALETWMFLWWFLTVCSVNLSLAISWFCLLRSRCRRAVLCLVPSVSLTSVAYLSIGMAMAVV